MSWKSEPSEMILSFCYWKGNCKISSFYKWFIECWKPKVSSCSLQISVAVNWGTKYHPLVLEIVIWLRQPDFTVDKHVIKTLMKMKRNVHFSVVNVVITCRNIVEAKPIIERILWSVDESCWLVVDFRCPISM